MLNQRLFSACHEYLSPASFLQQCRSDTCKCGTPCLCSALANYARHCRRFSVIVDFRSHVPDCGERPADCADAQLILQHVLLKENCNSSCVCVQPSPALTPCSTAPVSRPASADAPPSLSRSAAAASARRAASALRAPSTTIARTPAYTGMEFASRVRALTYIPAGSWSSGESSHFPQSDICICFEAEVSL